jgi:ankyrin repeat protein
MSATTRLLTGVAALLLLATFSHAQSQNDPGVNALRLIQAVKDQDRAAVRSLLEQKADVNAAQPDGATALHWAAYREDIETAGLLIRAGADVNAANEYGLTPLAIACSTRNAAVVGKLLDAGANPNLAPWSGVTPLMTAANTGNAEIAGLLIARGAGVNAAEPRRGQTALMWAIAAGYPGVARLLIEHGANVSARSHQYQEENFSPMVLQGYSADVQVTPQGGFTPLLFAARVGDLETARLLVSKGADVNESTPAEGNSLVVAAAAGHEELARFLLEQGADPNAVDGGGIAPLHYAMRDGLKVLHGYDISGAQRLCQSGAGARCLVVEDEAMLSDPRYKTFELTPPEEEKVLPGRNMLDLAKALLAHGAAPNAQLNTPPPQMRLAKKPVVNLTGATPFFLATASGDLPSMRVLVEARAKPLVGTVISEKEFFKDGHGDDNQIQGNATPLMVAIGMGRQDDFSAAAEAKALEAAKILVGLGADVNEATETGWTPLHAASFLGANSLIEFLVSQGANPNVKNGCGQTPLSLAEATDARGLLQRVTAHPETAKLLRSLGAGSGSVSGPVGRCVEGRFGLDYAVKPSSSE